MAEQSGAERPYRMQSLLGRSHWDADRLRDEVRDYVVEALGHEAGLPCAYILGDAVYGADSRRRMLQAREQPYVLAVRGSHFTRRGGDRGFEETSLEELASEFEPDEWACHAAAPEALGSTSGHVSAALGRQRSASSIGFSSAASGRHPAKKPTTSFSPRPVPPWPNWRQWPACAARSRSA